MEVIFSFQDVLEIMNNDLLALDTNFTEAQKYTYYRELSKKDGKISS